GRRAGSYRVPAVPVRGGALRSRPRPPDRRAGAGVRSRRGRHRRRRRPGGGRQHSTVDGRGRSGWSAGDDVLAAPAAVGRGGGAAGTVDVRGPGRRPDTPGAFGGAGRGGGWTEERSDEGRRRTKAHRSTGGGNGADVMKFYQVGSWAAGNRLLGPDEQSVQADPARANSLTSGHRACQGCGEALGARYVLDTAMRVT